MQYIVAAKMAEAIVDFFEIVKIQHEQEGPACDIESLIPAVDRLPEQSRKVFRMSYWEDMKSMDIASELSISVRTVEAILYKARKRLRDELKKF